jgi:hypothetical protein
MPPAGVALSVLLLLLIPATAHAEIEASVAIRVANRDAKVVKERQENGRLTHAVNKVDGNWEVGYFAADKEVVLVIVDPQTGHVRESWTGYQVAWKMARGYSGAFGHKLNAPYVFLPLCAIFLLGLLDWRRLRRIANLDLLVLLGFGVSNFFFNRAEIGVSVPLQYIPLTYLFGRALWIGMRGGGEGIRPRWPAAWLFIAALFLIGFRVGLNRAAYPYTAFTLLSNSNDSLVAMLLVATLLVLAKPAARGVMAALATLAKFAPAVLVPMLIAYRPAGPVTAGDPPPPAVAKASSGAGPPTVPPAGVTFGIAFVLTAFALLLWPAIDPGLHTVYERTIAYQAGRSSPFSIWGQVPFLEPLRVGILVGVAALSLLFAFRPKDKQLFQVAALGAVLLIGVQLTMHHWFYLYIVWFYPFLLVAMSASKSEKRLGDVLTNPSRSGSAESLEGRRRRPLNSPHQRWGVGFDKPAPNRSPATE